MSSNSSMTKLTERRISRDGLTWLLVGLVAGLVFGLLIGWVWWPVDWQGGSINSFSTEDKISYISAVADAYAPYSTQEALADAGERLAALGGDRDELIQEAIDYYSAQPDGSIQAANLAALASALASSAELPAQAEAAVESTSEATAAATATPAQSEQQGNGWGGFARILALLAGLALIGFGGYALWMLAKGRSLGGGNSSTPPPGQTPSEPFTPEPPTTSARSTISGYDPSQTARASSSYAQAQAQATRVSPVQPTAGAPTVPFEHEEAVDDAVTTFAASPVAAGSPERTAPAPERVTPTTPAVAASSLDRYPTIDRYTAEYVAGRENFDYSKSIPGGSNNYLGEYGIGISERHGVLNGDLDQVVAMEIYLFDKSDETQLVDVNRVLLSEYAHDHLLKHFERDKERLGPIVAQRNTVFDLSGRQLILKCNVRDVQYSSTGIFQRLIVDMELKKKG